MRSRQEHLFPPALVPLVRERLRSSGTCLAEVGDAVVERLLTVVFFAGLETNEHERNPIRVVFVGTAPLDLALSASAAPDAPPSYRWRTLRFAAPRPFSVQELVKLAVVKGDERLHTQVRFADGKLEVDGLAREGTSPEADPFLKIVAPRAGALSIGCGVQRVLEYERGSILTSCESLVFSEGPVRAALEGAARAAGLLEVVTDYLDSVRALVREMAAHGHGGILVISAEEHPELPEGSPYRIVRDSSVAALLRIARLLGRRRPSEPPGPSEPGAARPSVTFGKLLHSAFVAEAERTLEDFGALTAIDGATVVNRALSLVGFGVVLPIADARRALGADPPESVPRSLDLASRGTRHTAGAIYADQHPGSVVFVASEDGQVTCMLREPAQEHVATWRLSPELRPLARAPSR